MRASGTSIALIDLIDENRVDILVEAGMIEEALAASRRNEARAEALGDRLTFADSAAWTGYLLVEQGQIDLGLEHCERALDSHKGTESIDLTYRIGANCRVVADGR